MSFRMPSPKSFWRSRCAVAIVLTLICVSAFADIHNDFESYTLGSLSSQSWWYLETTPPGQVSTFDVISSDDARSGNQVGRLTCLVGQAGTQDYRFTVDLNIPVEERENYNFFRLAYRYRFPYLSRRVNLHAKLIVIDSDSKWYVYRLPSLEYDQNPEWTWREIGVSLKEFIVPCNGDPGCVPDVTITNPIASVRLEFSVTDYIPASDIVFEFDDMSLYEREPATQVYGTEALLAANDPHRPDEILGVNSWFRWGPDIYMTGNIPCVDKILNETHLRWMRAGASWASVEDTLGDFHIGVETSIDTLASTLRDRDMPMMYMLGYFNSLYWQYENTDTLSYDQHWGPTAPESIEGFARYSAVVADSLLDRYDVSFEVWNEPNVSSFWRPTPDPLAYATLARATIDSIHARRPNARVYIGSITSLYPEPIEFLRQVLESDPQHFADAAGITFHGYRWRNVGSGILDDPEGTINGYRTLEEMLSDFDAWENWDIVCSEWGYSPCNDWYMCDPDTMQHVRNNPFPDKDFGDLPVFDTLESALEHQGRYILRMAALHSRLGLDGSMIFQLGSYFLPGTDYYGLLGEDMFDERPAYDLLSYYRTILGDAEYVGMLPTSNSDCFANLYSDQSQYIAMIWVSRWGLDTECLIPAYGNMEAYDCKGMPIELDYDVEPGFAAFECSESGGPLYVCWDRDAARNVVTGSICNVYDEIVWTGPMELEGNVFADSGRIIIRGGCTVGVTGGNSKLYSDNIIIQNDGDARVSLESSPNNPDPYWSGVWISNGGPKDWMGTTIRGALVGLTLDYTSTTSVLNLNIEDCIVGASLSRTPSLEECVVRNVSVNRCTAGGMYVFNNFHLDDCIISNNGGYGVYLTCNTLPPSNLLVVSDCTIEGNDINVQIGAATQPQIVLGDTQAQLGGGNSILSPRRLHIRNDKVGFTLLAEGCYWGGASGQLPVLNVIGSIDFTPYLENDPQDLEDPQSKIVVGHSAPPVDTVSVYPNPFNATVEVHFENYGNPVEATVSVYDLTGRLVARLPVRETSGDYYAKWDGALTSGVPASSGAYFIEVNLGGVRSVHRAVLVK